MNKVRQKEIMTALQIAATYIGTVVGAGFASGQEVLQFFTRYGSYAVLGIGLTTLLFFVFGLYAMSLGPMHGAPTFSDVSESVMSKGTSRLISGMLLILLFGITIAMMAGSGALLSEQFHWSFGMSAIFTGVVTALTLALGMRGMMSVNSVIVPFLVVFVVVLFLYVWWTNHGAIMQLAIPSSVPILSPWKLLFSAFTYAGLNVGLSFTVLVPLGHVASRRKVLISGALLGAVGLGLLLFLLHLLLVKMYPDGLQYEVPMGHLALSLPPMLRYSFVIILWAEIFSTLLGNVYGIASELSRNAKHSYFRWVIVVLSAALLVCQVGFARIVSIAYPIFGYVGLFILMMILLSERRLIRL
ncbi:YkvI family membrane protein [Sulfoacidibacillus thermotolerans]|nr:hypothetical protein [Sulfoacidibacillus thermotolerans]